MSNPYSSYGVTDQEYNDYGDDFFKMQLKMSNAVAQAHAQSLASEVHKDVRKVERRSTLAALKERFERTFGQPFDPANDNPGFNDWLDQTGKRKALTSAYNSGNVDDTFAIFREYAHVPEHQRPENIRASNREVMQHAADREYGTNYGGGGRGGAITRKEINNFYQDIARRHAFYSTPEGQKAKAQMEERIQHALQTGQVR
jgi:hypothetical protein